MTLIKSRRLIAILGAREKAPYQVELAMSALGQKQTCAMQTDMSAKGQQRIHAPQQTTYSITSFASRGRSGCSTRKSLTAKLPLHRKNGGNDEYRSPSAGFAGSCLWAPERRPGLRDFGG